MLGCWLGFYVYQNEQIQKIVGFEKTHFEIVIDQFDGVNFSGFVLDDKNSGGMDGTGKIIGRRSGNLVFFEKHMPENSQIINIHGERKNMDFKHPIIYYSGKFLENKCEISGSWKFKRKLEFLFGFIPLYYRPGQGTWKMTLKTE